VISLDNLFSIAVFVTINTPSQKGHSLVFGGSVFGSEEDFNVSFELWLPFAVEVGKKWGESDVIDSRD
jgi:hypothetical protein